MCGAWERVELEFDELRFEAGVEFGFGVKVSVGVCLELWFQLGWD